MVETFEQTVESFDDGLMQKLRSKNDAAAIFEYLRKKVLLRE